MYSETRTVGLFQNKGLVALDGVRALAALAVVIPHYFLFQGTDNATLEFIAIVAVEVFFALSGYVLARQLVLCVETASWNNLAVFYSRRWMRTLPPYLIVLFFIAVASKELFSGDFWLYAFFIRNFSAVDPVNDFFVVAWSLAIEEWFYLVFPPFLMLAARLKVRILTAAFVFIFILFVAKIAYLLFDPGSFADARRIVILRLDSIAFGFILAVVMPRIELRRRVAFPALLLLCPLMLLLSISAAHLGNVFVFLYAAPAFAVSLIALLVFGEKSIRRVPLVPLAASFGANTSYMIYLVHTLVIIEFGSFFGAIPTALHFALYLIILLTICAFSYVAIEGPLLRNRPRYSRPEEATRSVAQVISRLSIRPARALSMSATNVIAGILVLVLIETAAGSIHDLYVTLRNSLGEHVGLVEIVEEPKTAGIGDPHSIYSSPNVPRDISANQNRDGGAYAYESYTVFGNRAFVSESVNILPNGMRSNGNDSESTNYNVWVFGSSPVFGITNADNETIPANIEKALRAEYPERPDISVANFGVVGYTSWQDVLQFQRRLQEMPKPEVVVFFNGHNEHNLAWLSRNEACSALLNTAVGSSKVLSESWNLRSHGGFVHWPAMVTSLQGWFPDTFGLVALVGKLGRLMMANRNIKAFGKDYRERRNTQYAVAETCVSREISTYRNNMLVAAALAEKNGIKAVFVHQPIIYNTGKNLIGPELGIEQHLRQAFFALDDDELLALDSVPSYRIDQAELWTRSKYNETYAELKQVLRSLAEQEEVRFVDLEPLISSHSNTVIFSSSIHFTFRGAEIIGTEIANQIADLIPDK